MKDSKRVALVTGASAGLGCAIAQRLARDGWIVGLIARRLERLNTLAEEIGSRGGTAYVMAGDATDLEFTDSAVRNLVSATSRLDLLVNNAGALTETAEPITVEIAKS